jgi:hypothetical protein
MSHSSSNKNNGEDEIIIYQATKPTHTYFGLFFALLFFILLIVYFIILFAFIEALITGRDFATFGWFGLFGIIGIF